MTLAPRLADVDLLFAVVLVVEFDDALGECEDSLAGPKKIEKLKLSQHHLLLADDLLQFKWRQACFEVMLLKKR